MSMSLTGGLPQVINVKVNAGTPTVTRFAGKTNYLQVTADGACQLSFASDGQAIALAAPGSARDTSFEGPVHTQGIVLNAPSGSVNVQIVAFLIC